MIPPWRAALAHALDALRPGGALEIVDFGDQAGLPRVFRSALRRWLAAFEVTPRDDLREELGALARARPLRFLTAAPFGGYAIRATVLKP